ncbi:MAG: protein tyrosine phosphatase family protein [Lyngbya sp. HA4199-MV5]|nr:protein tyrosine phosphatase family protein [Lyngbya sp. HA4199-MV5]
MIVKNVRRVSEKLTVTGQVQPDQLEQAIQEGFKSVLNLRSPDELGFATDEQQLVEALGLHYVHMPLKLEAIDEDLITAILNQLEHIPKPAIVHCAAGFRSASIAILSLAIQEGLTAEQTLAKARQLGFDFFDYACVNPQLKQRFVQYLNRYAQVAAIAS